MATFTTYRRAAALAAVALVLGSGAPHGKLDWTKSLDADELELVGYSGHVPDSTKPKLTAFFAGQSLRPRSSATLHIWDTARGVRLQVFRAATSERRILPSDVITGSPVTGLIAIGDVSGRTSIPVRIGSWQSGFYYVRLSSGDRVGYATFVLRPRHLGEHDVAIVLPTQTWEAYNFRDDDGDGVPDTWYVYGSHARLARPFLNRGVPPHYKFYDAPFLAWAHATHHEADYLSDAELNHMSGEQLRKAYRLVIFEGHHEYVTTHEYDAVQRYRGLGGNLAFLSANNFFWKITISGGAMTRVGKWRDLGRPEAALIGVEYYRNDMGEHRGAWILRRTATKLRWLFAGTDLRAGMAFGNGGIEADEVTPDSPRNVQIVADIPNLYGDGRNADMTYYETSNGAKVFAAGAFTIAGSVGHRPNRQVVANLWRRLSTD
jgi:hypothetical protein